MFFTSLIGVHRRLCRFIFLLPDLFSALLNDLHPWELVDYLVFEVSRIYLVEHGLILHELNLQILVRLVVVGHQIVDCFKQGGQTLAVVLFLQQEVFL
jgi:hypothetical protein